MAINESFPMILIAIALCCLVVNTEARWMIGNKLSWKRVIVVDQSGKGDYKNIQEAIDSVPSNNVESVFIRVEPGVYKEKVTVPEDKPFIILSGRKTETTIITWNDNGDIWKSPTVSILASDFVGRYLTIQNTYGAGAKAVALRVAGDRAEFYACKIVSYQDTLLDEQGRHFYNNCYIEGATDFICGNAVSIFQNCHIHSISTQNGAITAQHRTTPAEETGFFFVDSKITGVKSCTLGRPWGPYSRVLFIRTYMSNVVVPQGWDDWGKPSMHSTVYYGEYECYGPGANRSGRVEWSRSLTTEEASIISKDMIDGKSWIKA
ncbi:hypothetical protein Cgig2_026516 [Carnegiea gigantea]|uniref:Pectinesterase n=1 Tax=Carnegiea gigantea TaxID=171969 RepID=A0A9Q1QI15_9CARY|nr:hypothetical protein Cgig2_026516 [Carnegiea gigantea]